jgi:hypothetical protein
MLQSLLVEQPSLFYFENNNNWTLGRSKMSGKDNHQHHRRLPVSYVTPPSSLGEDSPAAAAVVEAHHEFEHTIPRTYSHSPSTLPPSTLPSATTAELQPWFFTSFPEPFPETPAYTAVVDGQYVPSADGLLYEQAVSSRTPTIHAYDERLHFGEHKPVFFSPSSCGGGHTYDPSTFVICLRDMQCDYLKTRS